MWKTKYNQQSRHGMCWTYFYHRYEAIMQRCNNPNNVRYKDYGGRGIKCVWKSFNEYKEDMYSSFLAHSNIHGTRQTTIERIDNNGNYCKENCKWVTMREQQRNTRCVMLFEWKSLLENCIERWMHFCTVYGRIRRGWSIQKALDTKPQ